MKLICLLFLMSIAASCNKDPEYYALETPVDQMLLKASSTEITLEKEKENEVAVLLHGMLRLNVGELMLLSPIFSECIWQIYILM